MTEAEEDLIEKVTELLDSHCPSDIIKVVASYVGGLVDNVHDSYKAGALGEEMKELPYEVIVPVLEAPLVLASSSLEAVAEGLNKAGY